MSKPTEELNREFINVPMTPDMKARIVKAAGKNEMSSARYMRNAVMFYMAVHNEWAIPGPSKRKGNI